MKKAKQTIEDVLTRTQKDLDTASIFLEDRGFDTLVSQLNPAAERVDAVADAVESLQEDV
jgi:hypothetical protein